MTSYFSRLTLRQLELSRDLYAAQFHRDPEEGAAKRLNWAICALLSDEIAARARVLDEAARVVDGSGRIVEGGSRDPGFGRADGVES